MCKRLYDVYCHLLDLSHLNLLALLTRQDLINKDLVKSLMSSVPWWARLVPIGLLPPATIASQVSNAIKKAAQPIINPLSVVETATEFQLLLDYFLRNKGPAFPAGKEYNRIVLCPLAIDFGFKGRGENCYFSLPPDKPIAHQVWACSTRSTSTSIMTLS